MRHWLLTLVWLFGFLDACFSGTVLCGYGFGNEALQRWSGGTTIMALNTAICLLSMGLAMMIVATILIRNGKPSGGGSSPPTFSEGSR